MQPLVANNIAFVLMFSSRQLFVLFAGIAADLYYKEGVVAFIGPGCTYALDPVARLAGYWNIPIVTGASL